MGLATTNSGRFSFISLLTLWLFFCCVPRLAAADPRFAARTEKAFAEARKAQRLAPTNIDAAIHLARAASDWAEFPMKDEQRADVANWGIAAARHAIDRSPTNAAAHYWLGMDLGQLARTKSLGALKLVKEMETEFFRARDLDERVDYAGPDRSLGLLYRDAPGWPTSIGSKKKAREHLERAAQIASDFPENQLCLLESLLQWADKQSFEKQLKVAERVMAQVPQKFSGDEWESNLVDWQKRFGEIRAMARELGKPVQTKGTK